MITLTLWSHNDLLLNNALIQKIFLEVVFLKYITHTSISTKTKVFSFRDELLSLESWFVVGIKLNTYIHVHVTYIRKSIGGIYLHQLFELFFFQINSYIKNFIIELFYYSAYFTILCTLLYTWIVLLNTDKL